MVAESEVNSKNHCSFDIDIPIVIRKGTSKCNKHPLYLTSNFVSFNNCSPSHKEVFMSPNRVTIPKTLFKTLTSDEWKNVTNIGMQVLEKKPNFRSCGFIQREKTGRL